MKKQDLKAQWGKYCDTDKIVDGMIDLLKYYGHRRTEHGVCTLLHEYFTNKEPLIKIIASSKNYIGDMRIALDKEFERKLDSNEIRYFFNNIHAKLNSSNILKHEDEDNKKMMDYMPTGKNLVDVCNYEGNDERKTKLRKFNYDKQATHKSVNDLNDFSHYMQFFSGVYTPTLTRDYSRHNDLRLAHGTKTSRAFNRVCEFYGVDKFCPEIVKSEENGKVIEKTIYPYNKFFAAYSDLVSCNVRKMKFMISVNPLDYLTMSLGVSWRSCHMIDGGMCQGGCLSYMLDTTSMITYVIDNLEGDIHRIPKLYRQMFHYSNDMFMQNRLYPQGNDGAVNLYDKFRDIVTEEFSSLLNVENKWKVDCGYSACKRHIVSKGSHYTDYEHNNSCNIFYPEKTKKKISDYVMRVGNNGICPYCGKEFTRAGAISHSSCTISNEEEVFEF